VRQAAQLYAAADRALALLAPAAERSVRGKRGRAVSLAGAVAVESQSFQGVDFNRKNREAFSHMSF
jgi:hypothetical protein